MRIKIQMAAIIIASLLVVRLTNATAQVAAVAPAPETTSLGIPETDDGLPGEGPIRRHDRFQKTWNERRSAFASHRESDRHALVFLGDSITQGWGDDLGGAFPGVKVANRGISGDTTRGMLIRLADDVLALHPSGVVMLMGTNDVDEQASAETIVGNIKLILAALHEQDPDMPIIVCQVMPSSATKKRPADKIRELNKQLAAAVKGDPHVTLVDTWALFANKEGDAKVEEFPDLLHPNKLGYAKWAAALRPVLATLGYIDTEPDDFKPEPGFESLFNGRDLTGWGCPPSSEADIKAAEKDKGNPTAPARPIFKEAATFDGQTATPDGRYVAKNSRLIVTTPTEGRRLQRLNTTREFPNDFVLRLEFRATPNADSGVFLRAPQLQCRDYILAGPYKELKNYKPQEWNELEVTVTGNTAHCTCNSEVLEAALKLPDTGPIGLEGDRGQMEYRRIRIKALP